MLAQERCEQRLPQAPAHQVSVEVCKEACGGQLMTVVKELSWGSGDFAHFPYSKWFKAMAFSITPLKVAYAIKESKTGDL